jgi:uncharacterized protein (TIGR02996 family)
MAATASALDRVERALKAGKANDALDAMLAAWRDKQAPAYAEAVEALGHAAADEVDALLATLLDGELRALAGRVEKLAAKPTDPRIALAFAKMAEDPPMTSSSLFPIWTKIFASLKASGDPRVVPILQKRLKAKPGASQFWPKLYSNLTKLVAAIPKAPSLTADETKRAKAIVSAATKLKPAKASKAPASKQPKAAKGDWLEAAKAGDFASCLESLLVEWRKTRIGALGTAIDRVSEILNDGLAPPHGKKLAADWKALAAKKNPADVGRLAEGALDGKPAEAEQRLEEMLEWPEDPRIGKAMLLAAHTGAFSDRSRAWKALGELLLRNTDSRFGEMLAEFAMVRTENKAEGAMKRRIAPLAAKANIPAASSDLIRKLTELDRILPSTSERKFLEAIFANPTDDAPRLVYADWLTERGHPRGEFIVLQCGEQTDDSKERIEELQEHAARALLGPAVGVVYSDLGYAIESGEAVFERGLLSKLKVYFSTPAWLYSGHPLFWFLTEVTPSASPDHSTLGLLDSARNPIALRDVSGELFEDLRVATKPLAIRSIEVSPGDHMTVSSKAFASIAFRNVEEIAMNQPTIGEILAMKLKSLRKLSFLKRYYLACRVDVDIAAKHITVSPIEVSELEVGAKDCWTMFDAIRGLPSDWKKTLDPRLVFNAKTKKTLTSLGFKSK